MKKIKLFRVMHRSSTGNVKAVAMEQYKVRVDAALSVSAPPVPKEGWLRAIRKSLDMSGAQLARRLGISRNNVSIWERKEVDGNISLNRLRELAEGLNADLVYAIVPRKSVEQTIDERATDMAKLLVEISNQNMFLEAQQLSKKKLNEEIKMIAEGIKDVGGKLLWNDTIQEKQQK